MSDPIILPVRPGTLKPADKKALRAAGVIVIECDVPEDLRLLRPSSEFDSSEMLRAAMRGVLANTMTPHSAYAFTRAMAEFIEQRAKKVPHL